jgi:hypothetical protein
MTSNDLKNLLNLQAIQKELSRRQFKRFVAATKPDYVFNWHHDLLIEYLQMFIDGEIRKLMVFMPPQHGKSELTSRRLPADLLGVNPNLKIVGCSYSSSLSSSFNRDVQRIICDETYSDIFPDTTLNSSNVRTSAKGSFLRNADIFEVVGKAGFYKSVGVGGSLTGTPVDIGIIDDPVKDVVEANSLTYRARVWDWYNGVFTTRLHNDSQVLITQTRWHEDDLSGRILRQKDAKDWTILTLPGILMNGGKHEKDPREIGEALWPNRHNAKKLLNFQEQSPRLFQAMYQQDPKPFEGGLVYPRWGVISELDYRSIKIEAVNGLDFGYSTSPAAAVEVKIDLVNKRIYAKQLVYKRGMGIDELGKELKRIIASERAYIVADSADPILIDHLKSKHRLNVSKAVKGPDSVSYGISVLNEFELIIVEGSTDLAMELSNYRYKEDANGNPLDEPIKEFDHLLDALRYIVTAMISKKSNKFKMY